MTSTSPSLTSGTSCVQFVKKRSGTTDEPMPPRQRPRSGKQVWLAPDKAAVLSEGAGPGPYAREPLLLPTCICSSIPESLSLLRVVSCR